MKDKIIHKFKLSDREEVRIRIGEYKGKAFLDQRVFFKPDGEENFRPSKDALRLNPKFYPELKKGIELVEDNLV